MKNRICETFGIDIPLIAFSHQRDVIAAVSNSGGMGVLGIAMESPEQLEADLTWLDEHISGDLPYGADVLIAGKYEGKGQDLTEDDYIKMLPPATVAYRDEILRSHDIDPSTLPEPQLMQVQEETNQTLLDIVWQHPRVKLVANALGVPPQFMVDQAHEHGVKAAALVGAKEHALKQVKAGVDILVVQGTEAGGHCGEVSTLVIVPEVIEAVHEAGYDPLVLAAGGIVTGRQMAAAIALGADGVWTGSVWLVTEEAETNPVVKQKYLAASSRDTVRSKGRTGKPARQLKSDWTAAWEADAGGPGPLPMPLQGLISEPAHAAIGKLAQSGHSGATQLATYFVGQGVGLLHQIRPAKDVVFDFAEDYAAAAERLAATLDD